MKNEHLLTFQDKTHSETTAFLTIITQESWPSDSEITLFDDAVFSPVLTGRVLLFAVMIAMQHQEFLVVGLASWWSFSNLKTWKNMNFFICPLQTN